MQWYIAVMEDGFDSREVVKDLAEERVISKKLRDRLFNESCTHDEKMRNIKSKLKDTQNQLVKLNEEVAKPLIQEIKIVQQLNERYRSDAEKNHSDLKVLNAIIRLPVMSDMF